MASDTDTAAGNLDTIEPTVAYKAFVVEAHKIRGPFTYYTPTVGKLSISFLLAQAAICIMSIIFLVSDFLRKLRRFQNLPAAFAIYMLVVGRYIIRCKLT